MHKYITLFFSVTLFWCGCKSDSVPGKYIQPETMTDLLVQIHLIDGSLYNNTQAPDSLYKYGMGKYLDAFNKYHVDSAMFRKSFDYYSSEPDKLIAIYDQVDLKIKALNDSVTQVQNRDMTARRKADSVRADSARKANLKKIGDMTNKADSAKRAQASRLKSDSVKKLKHTKPNAVPIK